MISYCVCVCVCWALEGLCWRYWCTLAYAVGSEWWDAHSLWRGTHLCLDCSVAIISPKNGIFPCDQWSLVGSERRPCMQRLLFARFFVLLSVSHLFLAVKCLVYLSVSCPIHLGSFSGKIRNNRAFVQGSRWCYWLWVSFFVARSN